MANEQPERKTGSKRPHNQRSECAIDVYISEFLFKKNQQVMNIEWLNGPLQVDIMVMNWTWIISAIAKWNVPTHKLNETTLRYLRRDEFRP